MHSVIQYNYSLSFTLNVIYQIISDFVNKILMKADNQCVFQDNSQAKSRY